MKTNNRIWIYSLIVVGLVLILFNTCEKQGRYDLFPLKVGNVFYYKFSKSIGRYYTEGTETWKVVSESLQGNSINYIIERNLNGTLIVLVALGDTTLITDSITQLQVIENKSTSAISVFGFNFKRYQDVSQIELKQEGFTIAPSLTCIFKADSGMTKYYYYHPPNQIVYESLQLDSLKTFN
jgi:hypothetical protein